jgi:hypothetical protein
MVLLARIGRNGLSDPTLQVVLDPDLKLDELKRANNSVEGQAGVLVKKIGSGLRS